MLYNLAVGQSIVLSKKADYDIDNKLAIKIVKEYLKKYFKDMPFTYPSIENRNTNWLGYTMGRRDPNGKIHAWIVLNNSKINDERTLRRVIAHELIHLYDVFLHGEGHSTPKNCHDDFFKEHMNRINAKEGKNFVTEYSNKTYKVKANTEGLDLKELSYAGHTFKTGLAVTFPYIRNTISSKTFKIDKKRFQQDIEPAGKYVNLDDTDGKNVLENWEIGKATIKNPIVLSWNGYGEKSWKMQLFKKYHKKGKALSNAILKDGYDGIITIDGRFPSEIVLLKPN